MIFSNPVRQSMEKREHMEEIYDNWELFQQFLNLLEQHLGPKCELVLHDLTKDYGNTIADIRNGYISGRRIGDPGGELGFEVASGMVQGDDRYNKILHTKDGKIIRSSTAFFRNRAGTPIGSMCINMDITESVRCEEFLRSFNMCDPAEAVPANTSDLFADVNELLSRMINEAIAKVGVPPEEMSREEKIQVVAYLDEKRAFLISKSSERVCECLGISKFTLYNYLDSIRSKNAG